MPGRQHPSPTATPAGPAAPDGKGATHGQTDQQDRPRQRRRARHGRLARPGDRGRGRQGRHRRPARRRGPRPRGRARRRRPLRAPRRDRRPSDWEAAVATAVSEFGGLNVLVNNAGIVNFGRLGTYTLAPVEPPSSASTSREPSSASPRRRRRWSRPPRRAIVNISSTAGLQGTTALHGYVASKFALRGLTKSVALELRVGERPLELRAPRRHPHPDDRRPRARRPARRPAPHRRAPGGVDTWSSTSPATSPASRPGRVRHRRRRARGRERQRQRAARLPSRPRLRSPDVERPHDAEPVAELPRQRRPRGGAQRLPDLGTRRRAPPTPP